MAEQLGRTIVIKVGDNAASEAFNTLGGLRTKSMAVNNEQVDISNADSGQWRKLLAAAGIRSMSMTAGGVFDDGAAIDDLEQYAFDGSIQDFQITWPDGDQWDFKAQVASFTYAGEHNGEQTYDVSLESSEAVTITTG